jgi:hypothetical protein
MKLDYKKSIAFMRDGFVPFADAHVSIGSSPVLYGLAIYTVFGVNWNEKKEGAFDLSTRGSFCASPKLSKDNGLPWFSRNVDLQKI